MARIRIDCAMGVVNPLPRIEHDAQGRAIGPPKPRWIPTVDIRMWASDQFRAWTWEEPGNVWHTLVGSSDGWGYELPTVRA